MIMHITSHLCYLILMFLNLFILKGSEYRVYLAMGGCNILCSKLVNHCAQLNNYSIAITVVKGI